MRPAFDADIPRPGRLPNGLPEAPQAAAQSGRAGESRPVIAITRSRYGHVYRENQHRAARCFGLSQKVAHEFAVANHVELEPERIAGRRRNFFDRASTHGGERERHTAILSGAHGLNFAAARVHTGNADGCECDRHGVALAEQLDGQVDIRYVAGDTLPQCDAFEVSAIPV